MSLVSIVNSIVTKCNALKNESSGKVIRFGYTSYAYSRDKASYDEANGNSIPPASAINTDTNENVLVKGYRTQSASFARKLFNHFFGRVSYNMNKAVDMLYSLSYALSSALIQSAGGLVLLDSSGRVQDKYVPEDIVNFRGAWNASTNIPDLNTVTKEKGDMYLVSVTGTWNNVKYFAGDEVVYNGSTWQRIASGNVDTVNGKIPDASGAVTLYGDDVNYDLPYPLEMVFTRGTCTVKDRINCIFYLNNLYLASVEGYGIWWSSNGTDWTRGSATSGEFRNTFTYFIYSSSKSLYIAGGFNASLWWSEDGKTWTQGTGGSTASNYNFIYEGNNIFIASGDTNGLWWSEDGKAWTQVTGVTSSYGFREITSFNGVYYACSLSHGIWTSSDGKNWTQVSGNTSTISFYSIKVWSNSVIMASAFNGMWWSEDGSTWTKAATSPVANSQFCYITVSPTMATVGSANKGMWWTTDGKTWTQGTSAADTFDKAEVYVSGQTEKWIAGSYSGGIYYSSDGKNWTQVSGTTSTMRFQKYTLCATSNCFLAGALFYGMWKASSNSGTWSQVFIPFITRFNGFSYALGKYIGSAERGLYYSVDGNTWMQSSFRTSSIFTKNVEYHGIVVTGSSSVNPCWSENGETWNIGTTDSTAAPCSILYKDIYRDLLICSANVGAIIWSEDGKYWTHGTGNNLPATVRAIYSNNNIVVMGTISNGLWWSEDGKAWVKGTSSESNFSNGSFYAVLYAGGKWIAGSDRQDLWYSSDGKTWSKVTGSTNPSNWRVLAYHDSLYLAGNTGNVIMRYSTDGENWSPVPDIPACSISDLVWAENVWVASSASEGILWSLDGLHWKKVTGLPESNFNSIAFIPETNKLLSGSYSSGAFSTERQTKASISYIINYLKGKFGYNI